MIKFLIFCAVSIVSIAMIMSCRTTKASATTLPDPVTDTPLAEVKGSQTAVLAGGCFWGIEAVFEHVKGVTNVRSGYSGGSADSAQYQRVARGETGHAEAVEVTYDPSQISYGQLLKVFFSVAHDPTELNRQGPDVGSQYRSAIFYANDEQKRVAQAYIDQLNQAKVFPSAIVTELAALQAFYEAEAYHQDYLVRNPDQPYIVIHDMPKLENLKKELPGLYKKK